jgi:hypothetical protein
VPHLRDAAYGAAARGVAGLFTRPSIVLVKGFE